MNLKSWNMTTEGHMRAKSRHKKKVLNTNTLIQGHKRQDKKTYERLFKNKYEN